MKTKSIVIILILMVISLGCVTTSTVKPGPECSGSVWAQDPQMVENTLKSLVFSSHALALYDVAAYNSIHKSSSEIIPLLEVQQSFGQINVNNKTQVILSMLLTLWAPDQILHPCDLKIILAYLKMI